MEVDDCVSSILRCSKKEKGAGAYAWNSGREPTQQTPALLIIIILGRNARSIKSV